MYTWEIIWSMYLDIDMAASMAYQEMLNLLDNHRSDEAALADKSRRNLRECENTAWQMMKSLFVQ